MDLWVLTFDFELLSSNIFYFLRPFQNDLLEALLIFSYGPPDITHDGVHAHIYVYM